MDVMANRGYVPGRVTVITATYNAEKTLARCIDSVTAQEYPEIEHIVMDGGSTDRTLEILKSYGDRLIWRSERDRGIYDAWNKSLAVATGEWIVFLGADDLFLPGAVNAYMDHAKGSGVEYISSLVKWVQNSGDFTIIGDRWTWPRFQRRMTTAHVGSMHKRTLFDRYGLYDISYRIVGDYEFLLRPRGSLRAGFLSRITTEMAAGGASDSYAALRESRRAKVVTGGRNIPASYFELWVASAKLTVRRLLAKLRFSEAQ